MIRLADRNISERFQGKIDPEDVAASVCRTFIRHYGSESFHIESDEDLWKLLVTITLTKTRNKARHFTTEKRDVSREHGMDQPGLVAAMRNPPGPDEAAEFLDTLSVLKERLDDELAVEVLLKLLNGESQVEIAEQLGKVTKTIQRKKKKIEEALKEMGFGETETSGSLMRLYYSEDYSLTLHQIDATQKPRWIAESLGVERINGVELHSPPIATREQLERVHSQDYVRAVETGDPRDLAESSSYDWNQFTWISELASCGGMLAACDAALVDGVSGSLSAGFHHARRERGHLHCIFNGLALAVRLLHDRGIERILYVDVDAHCGGGVYSLVGDLPGYHHLDVSLFPTDKFQPGPNATLDIVESADRYLTTVKQRLDEIASRLSDFQLCIYYAGMDPHQGSAYGGLPGIDTPMLRERDELVFAAMRDHYVPVAFCLGGGYLGDGLDQRGLVELHRNTIQAARPPRS